MNRDLELLFADQFRMAFAKVTLLAWLGVLLQPVHGQNITDKLKYVDQLIGSANGGMYFSSCILKIEIT